MNNQLIKSVLKGILSQSENKELALSPAFRPPMLIDGHSHPVLKLRIGENDSLEGNIQEDLWAKISFEPRTNGFVNPDVLAAFVEAELAEKEK